MAKKIQYPWQLKAQRLEAATEPPVNIYVDNSNVFIEGQRLAFNRGENRPAFRLHFRNFIDVLRRGRAVREMVWAGSVPPPTDSVWRVLQDTHVEPELLERTASGESGNVDRLVQLRMHRHTRKHSSKPGTIVLCTGDGAGYESEEGFLYDVEMFVEEGWGLELYSWPHCCHRRLRDYAEKRGKFLSLEDIYEYITFIEQGRPVKMYEAAKVKERLGLG